MKTVVFLTLASVACGLQYNGLRVKYGTYCAYADLDYFYKIPRTITDAKSEGWRKTQRPPGPLPELSMYCSPGRTVCSLFHTNGFIAGLQIALPVDDYETPITDLEKKFVKWHAPADHEEPAQDFWTSTQYYFSEECRKKRAAPQVENGDTLQDGGVWVTGPDGNLMKISTNEAALKNTPYTKQNCIPNIGTRYYYNTTRDSNCKDLYQWSVLTDQEKLIGTGYQSFGKINRANTKSRRWFEEFPKTEQDSEVMFPNPPKCYEEIANKYGLISLHVYYTDSPWDIDC